MKKIPIRKCVVTKEQLPKNELIRIVLNKDGKVFVDTTGKQNGRGAYLNLKKSVIDKAQKSNVLGRILKCEIPNSLYDELNDLLEGWWFCKKEQNY